MGRVSFHLSSTNSRDLGNSKHEINLSPGLEIDGAADPVCYLHDLSFTNTIANVDDTLYKNGTVNLGLGQVDGGNVQLHVPAGQSTKLYVGFITGARSYCLALHSDAATAVNAAYATTAMKPTLAAMNGMVVEGKDGLLSLINDVLVSSFGNAQYCETIGKLAGATERFGELVPPTILVPKPASAAYYGLLRPTCTPFISSGKVYFNGLCWTWQNAVQAAGNTEHDVKGDTTYAVTNCYPAGSKAPITPGFDRARYTAMGGTRLMTTAEIQKAMSVTPDNGGMPGNSGSVDSTIMSVTELLGIQVGINGTGASSSAAPGSGLFTGEYSGANITSNEGVSATFTWPYFAADAFVMRPNYPHVDSDRLGQSTASQAGGAYREAIQWSATLDCHGSFQHVVANNAKFSTCPTGPTLFPSAWKGGTVARGGVTVSDGSTFGWTTISTTETQIIATGSYSLAQTEKSIASAFKADTSATSIYAKVSKTTVLADPDNEQEWKNAVSVDDLLDGAHPSATTKQKFITLDADDDLNRVRCYMAGGTEILADSTLFSSFLGFTQTGNLLGVAAANVARIDRARGLAFHCPSLCAGVYDTSGKLGGSQMALVPITAAIGMPQVWTASVPIKLTARVAGSKVDRLLFYLSSEDGDQINMQEDRFDAVVVLEW